MKTQSKIKNSEKEKPEQLLRKVAALKAKLGPKYNSRLQKRTTYGPTTISQVINQYQTEHPLFAEIMAFVKERQELVAEFDNDLAK